MLRVETGPTICIDGPADHMQDLFRGLHRLDIPGIVRWEGPLRSLGSTGSDHRLLFKVYLSQQMPALATGIAIAALRTAPELQHFLIGEQRLYADPTALRVELPNLEAMAEITNMFEQAVVVSSRLLLIHTVAEGREWNRILTAMHQQNPEHAVQRLTWRRGHNDGGVFALPEALPARVTADRAMARGRRRPAGIARHQEELVTLAVRGPLGPCPETLLTELVAQVQLALGRPLARAPGDNGLQHDHFRERREGNGTWDGSLVLRLQSLDDTRNLYALAQGAVLDIGGATSTVHCSNSRLDATGSGNGGGSRE